MATAENAKLSGTERGKRDKARRIREASRAMFLTKGFDDATIRDIARMAEVAQGTLFLYAASKRDLLFMLYNDLIEAACKECLPLAGARLSLAEVLMRIALIHFQKFSNDMGISRISLVNLNLYDNSGEAARFSVLHRQMKDLIEGEFRASRDSGTLQEDFSVELMSALVLNVLIEMFKTYVRSDLPDIRKVMEQSHGQISVILRGLSATPQAMEIVDPDLRDWIGLPAKAEPGTHARSAG
ncbi:TetR/AcrR family transcriptional regulator [Roseinatronobacter sp.]